MAYNEHMVKRIPSCIYKVVVERLGRIEHHVFLDDEYEAFERFVQNCEEVGLVVVHETVRMH